MYLAKKFMFFVLNFSFCELVFRKLKLFLCVVGCVCGAIYMWSCSFHHFCSMLLLSRVYPFFSIIMVVWCVFSKYNFYETLVWKWFPTRIFVQLICVSILLEVISTSLLINMYIPYIYYIYCFARCIIHLLMLLVIRQFYK